MKKESLVTELLETKASLEYETKAFKLLYETHGTAILYSQTICEFFKKERPLLISIIN